MAASKTLAGTIGYCPTCGAPGVSRRADPTRRGGIDVCENMHHYPSSKATRDPKRDEPITDFNPTKEERDIAAIKAVLKAAEYYIFSLVNGATVIAERALNDDMADLGVRVEAMTPARDKLIDSLVALKDVK
jgi:hypothetical protein